MILHRHLLIHVEWHKGYGLLPRVRVHLEPQPGDLVKDGDHVDRVIRCPLCSGDGTLLAAVTGAVATVRPQRETTPQRIGGERTIREDWQARQPGEPFPLGVALAHVVAPVDLTMPKRGGLGLTACGRWLDNPDMMIATTPAAITCPTCAAAYAADPSLLGPV